tara:strand:+ start:882 stop:1574 length:693 start_codon:yes stop_codon:yes gene_type:complete
MKITKQRLKEIIKEELENSQNEGLFGKLKAKLGFGSKKWKPLTDKFEKENTRLYRAQFDMKTGAELEAAIKAMEANYNEYMDALADEDLTKDQQSATDSTVRMYRSELENVADYAEQMGAREAKEAAEKAEREARERAEREADYERRARRSRRAQQARDHANSGERGSSRKSGFDKWQSGEGDNYNYMTRMEEGKITRRDLKSLIAEELTKTEKARKKKLEKELDTLKHK